MRVSEGHKLRATIFIQRLHTRLANCLRIFLVLAARDQFIQGFGCPCGKTLHSLFISFGRPLCFHLRIFNFNQRLGLNVDFTFSFSQFPFGQRLAVLNGERPVSGQIRCRCEHIVSQGGNASFWPTIRLVIFKVCNVCVGINHPVGGIAIYGIDVIPRYFYTFGIELGMFHLDGGPDQIW